jgi:hypothetical protein
MKYKIMMHANDAFHIFGVAIGDYQAIYAGFVTNGGPYGEETDGKLFPASIWWEATINSIMSKLDAHFFPVYLEHTCWHYQTA